MAEFLNDTADAVVVPYVDANGVDAVIVVGEGASIVTDDDGPVAAAAQDTDLTAVEA